MASNRDSIFITSPNSAFPDFEYHSLLLPAGFSENLFSEKQSATIMVFIITKLFENRSRLWPGETKPE